MLLHAQGIGPVFSLILFRNISYQLKEASVKDANATPPTIGIREETTHKDGICVHNGEKVREIIPH